MLGSAGNGAQYSMWIPELDLVIAANGGNYNGGAANFWLLSQFDSLRHYDHSHRDGARASAASGA